MDLAASLARLRPRVHERIVLVNLLGLLGLPLLAYLIFLGVNADQCVLELPVQCDQPTELRLDVRDGGQTTHAVKQSVRAARASATVRFEFWSGRIDGLRLHLGRGAGVVRVGAADLRSQGDETLGSDRVLASFAPGGFHPAGGILKWSPLLDGAGVQIMRAPAAADPVCTLDVPRALDPGFNARVFVGGAAMAALLYAAVVLLALTAWRRLVRGERFRRRAEQSRAALEHGYLTLGRLVHARPRVSIWLVALAGVLVSCYPIVFCGKTFVSPNLQSVILYDRYPTLPGGTDVTTSSAEGSDDSAILWAFVPYAAAQRRAIFQDHEFPFWNRYSSGGLPLLGQGQSMIGDPLHWVVLLGGGDAGAWDLKFLLAKLFFAAGVGFVVRAATRHQPTALLLAFTACFIGFFTFHFNHPAFFSVCYAPWILFAWLEIARAGASPGRLGLLLLANWCEMTSGTVKEAYMLLLGVTAGGVLVFILSDARTWRQKAKTFVALGWVGLCFVLVSAPVWWTLLDTVIHSWSEYNTPSAWQLQPGMFVGLFDDIFYRQFNTDEHTLDPSANFIVLLGAALAVAAWKPLVRRERTFLACGLAGAAAAALAFGVVSPGIIKAVPFLGNVSHCDNTFSSVLLIFLFVVAGHGLARAWRRFGMEDFAWDAAGAVAVLVVLVGAFLGLTQAAQRSNIYFLALDTSVAKSQFFWADLAVLGAAFVALPFLLRRFCLDRAATAPGVAPWLLLALGAMCWRQAQHLPLFTGLDRYAVTPQQRTSFYGHSDAVEFLRGRLRAEPGRTQGLGDNLVPGFGAALDLETPSGPDALQNLPYHRLLLLAPLTWEWRLNIERTAIPAQGLRRFLDLLNVRYYVDRAGNPDIPGLRRIRRSDLDVYESDTAWPRAFFTDGVEPGRSEVELAVRAARGDGRPFAAVGPELLAARPALAALLATPDRDAARQVVPATDYRLTSGTTTFRVHAPGPGVVTLMEGYTAGGAEVTVNGRPAEHFAVDGAFSGVRVDGAGDYVVSYRYRPPGWARAVGACALGLMLLAGSAAGWVVWMRRRVGVGVGEIVGRGNPAALESSGQAADRLPVVARS